MDIESSDLVDQVGRKGKFSGTSRKFLGGCRSAGLACWNLVLFVWVKLTFVTSRNRFHYTIRVQSSWLTA